MKGRAAAVVVVAASLAFAALCECAPAAVSAALHGFNFDPRYYGSSGGRGLDLIHGAGAETIRLDLSWDRLEPSAPVGGQIQPDPGYVSEFDGLLQSAAAKGIRVIAVLHKTPCWASSAPDGRRAPCVPGAASSDYQRFAPSNPSDYAAIAAWVAQRWGSQLAALEVWNEPNFTRFLYVNDAAASPDSDTITTGDPQAFGADDPEGTDEAQIYTQLLQAAYPAIKGYAPHLPVLAGALAYSASGFLARLYADGIHGYFDALSVHPYDDQPGYERTGNKALSFPLGMRLVRDGMVSHGDADKALWLTEFGWPTCAPYVMDWCVSEQQQAEKLIQEFQLIGGWQFIGAAIIYCLVDPGTDPNNFEDNMGLLHYDWSPKPAWNAFLQAMAWLRASPETPPAASPPGATPHTTAGHKRHPKVTVARMVRLDSRHLLLSLVCKARRSCRSTVEVLSRGRGRRRGATLRVTLRPGSHTKRIITLPRWLQGKAVRIRLVSAGAAQRTLARAWETPIG
jgi:hypothetical protein